jgi:Pregnancy-associated plasma protein-A
MRQAPRCARPGLMATALVLWLATAAQAQPVREGAACLSHAGQVASARGATARDVVELSGKDHLTRWLARHPNATSRAEARLSGRPITVSIAFHVIRKDLTPEGGNVSDAQIEAQVDVLNDSYGGRTGGARTGFQFELTSVDRTTNKHWFNLAGYGKDRAMKTALKVGGPETLNIYSADLGKFLLGYAYLAQDADAVGVLDGVVIHYGSLPGGPFGAQYSRGDTATHEVGHWFNLLHTFDGGCDEPGDYVDDTPTEASPAFRCPVGRDTCPAAGLDPIRNFMDYTYDKCMNEFTRDQAVRMQEAWTAYRAP